jgi:hypothetical protein
MTERTGRSIAVTVALSGLGATTGALAGAAYGFGLASMRSGFAPPSVGEFVGVGAAVGALCGGLLLPTVAWARLREVPIGELTRVLGAGAAIGAALGWIIQPMWAPALAVAGFFVAVRRLAHIHSVARAIDAN